MTAMQTAWAFPVVGLTPVSLREANELLTAFGHYLGPVNRPFGSQSWVLDIDGRAVAVAVSASLVSAHVTDDDGNVVVERGQAVELARLASAERWATRVMLRLWREVAAPRWPYWSVRAAVAYSQNERHDGTLYRFDGWTRVRTTCGSSGGGTWSQLRSDDDAVTGPKTAWLWRYEDTDSTGGAKPCERG